MNLKELQKYSTLVFDCDGVVLNSNQVKTNAFYKATLPYGKQAAETFIEYHIQHGGISRYKKFAYFLESIVPSREGPGFDELLQRYADEVVEGLLNCDIAPGLRELREQTSNSRWLIVSGGDQDELRFVFERRCLASLFDGGIFGSPTPKKEILDRETANKNIKKPAIFLGDSRYDYESAQHAELEFLFISGWSEVSDWKRWVSENGIISTPFLFQAY